MEHSYFKDRCRCGITIEGYIKEAPIDMHGSYKGKCRECDAEIIYRCKAAARIIEDYEVKGGYVLFEKLK